MNLGETLVNPRISASLFSCDNFPLSCVTSVLRTRQGKGVGFLPLVAFHSFSVGSGVLEGSPSGPTSPENKPPAFCMCPGLLLLAVPGGEGPGGPHASYIGLQALCADVVFGQLSEVPGALVVEKVPIRRSWLALCFLYSALPSRLQSSASQLLRFCCCCC